jgi:hypothetical protein
MRTRQPVPPVRRRTEWGSDGQAVGLSELQLLADGSVITGATATSGK